MTGLTLVDRTPFRNYESVNNQDGSKRERRKNTPGAIAGIKTTKVMDICCHFRKPVWITFACPYGCILFSIYMEGKAVTKVYSGCDHSLPSFS